MNKILSGAVFAFAALAAGVFLPLSTQAQSPYGPIFNNYSDVKGVGNEADFLRIQKPGGTLEDTVDTIEACSGDVNVWFYVHNSQASANNGTNNDGPGVAHNTRVQLTIPSATANNHTLTGKISATEVTPITDTTKITCGGKQVKLEFVSQTLAKAPTGYTLDGSIVSAGGAKLGYDGVVPGCWDFRAWIIVKVRIVPEVPKVETLSCTNATLTYIDRAKRTIKVTVNGAATNGASISGYRIDFGDGTVVNQQTAEHTYAKDGNYTIVTRVLGTLNGKEVDVTSKSCTVTASFSTKPPVEPPVTPPTEIPNTGAGSTLALFIGTVLVSAAAYRLWIIRRVNQ